jgi:Raf kinase inhibitor-like YbhB/YbcL family protein
MKKLLIIMAVTTILAIILYISFVIFFDFEDLEAKTILTKMKITSPAFENNGNIPNKYSCNGEDINPPIEISEIPEGTQQLILIMTDPDALPIAGKIWDHWILFNFKPTSSIPENSVPQGATQGANSAGKNQYQGPCPPAGSAHHYIFKLYAVETGSFDIPDGSSKKDVELAMKDHILAEAELTGLYKK